MTGRDRMVLICVVVVALLGGVFLKVVSPERKQAAKLASEVSGANAQLSSAETQLQSARSAQAKYAAAYASIVELGKAVPPGQEVPSLIYQLARASDTEDVNFNSITTGSGSPSTSSTTPKPEESAGGFSQLPFTFGFEGTFNELAHLFENLEGFTTHTASGGLQVTGRLLTIQSVKLALETKEKSANATKALLGTVGATAYTLPASQGLTGGGTPSSPGTATPTSTGASSSPTTPAVARVTP
jgi:Tfp pilus assembly protein PilO